MNKCNIENMRCYMELNANVVRLSEIMLQWEKLSLKKNNQIKYFSKNLKGIKVQMICATGKLCN